MKNKHTILLFFIFILFIFFQTFPYLYGYMIAKDGQIFSGYLLYWNDVSTYIAKMKQGYEGQWLFKLDYAINPGTGVFIYPVYLVLGHIARIFHINLISFYHISRLIFATLMFFSIYRFTKHVFLEKSPITQLIIFFISLAGNGFSWIGIYFSDSLASTLEAFPSSIANVTPHYALTLTLLFYLLTPNKTNSLTFKNYLIYAILSIILAFVSPFSIVILIFVLAGILSYKLILKQEIKESFRVLLIIGNSSGWIILYQYYKIITHPVLKIWNQQNIIGDITFSNFLFSFFPYSILLFFSIFQLIKNLRQIPINKIVIYIWTISIPLFLIIPIDFNTRFLIGGFVPLSMTGLDFVFNTIKKEENQKKLKIFLFYSASLLLIAEISLWTLIIQKYSTYKNISFFIPQDVYQTYQWIDKNLPENSYILTEDRIGNYLPRFTSSIPSLGHWCETPNNAQQRQLTTDYFAGTLTTQDLLQNNIDYIFYGPNETQLGITFDTTHLTIVYQNATVTLYQLTR